MSEVSLTSSNLHAGEEGVPGLRIRLVSLREAQIVHWTLRIGAFACYVGHGAFGIITKAAWVVYFAIVGIPEWMAWRLMPVVGTVDIALGILVLIRPMPVVLLYMTFWSVWTALCRPFAGEGW